MYTGCTWDKRGPHVILNVSFKIYNNNPLTFKVPSEMKKNAVLKGNVKLIMFISC